MVLGRQIQLSQPVQKEGRDNLAPALIHFTRGYYYYLSRSLALPNLFLAVPFVWSERPSDFLASSPVTAPVASLALPFALSRAPSPLSWPLLFLPTCLSLRQWSRAKYILSIRDSARKVTSRARGRVSSIRQLPRRGLLGNWISATARS